MKSIIQLVLLSLSLVIAVGCGENSASAKQSGPTPTIELPQIPQSEILKLYQEADFIDFIFYDLKFSMSYDEKDMIQKSIKWVSPTVPLQNSNCHPMCRMVYQDEGNILMEAELHVSTQCGYIIWLRDGKPAYANTLTPEGYKHYINLTEKFNQ